MKKILLILVPLVLLFSIYVYYSKTPSVTKRKPAEQVVTETTKEEDPYLASQKLLKEHPTNEIIKTDPTSEIEVKRAQNKPQDLKILDEIDTNLFNQIQVLKNDDGTYTYYKNRAVSIWYELNNQKGEKFYFVNTITYGNNKETGKTEYSFGGHLTFTKKLIDGTWIYLGGGQEGPENILCSTLDSWGIPKNYKCLLDVENGNYREGVEFKQRDNIIM